MLPIFIFLDIRAEMKNFLSMIHNESESFQAQDNESKLLGNDLVFNVLLIAEEKKSKPKNLITEVD